METKVGAPVSDTFASTVEIGTSLGIGLVTTISMGTVVIDNETRVVINGCDGVGECEPNGVSGIISLSEDKSRITSFRFLLFLLIFFAKSSTLHFLWRVNVVQEFL